ncbi:23621_t:CDS:2, partial [Cetraspora pellucida]
MNEPDINDPDMNELDINEHEMNEPDIIEPDINEPNINENNILEKCTKCRKFLLQNKFIKKKNTLKKKILKSCESCHQQSSSHYKDLVEHYENEVLLSEEMVEKLFNEISLVGSDEYFENDSDEINFKSIIVLNDFKNQGDTPQEIAKKIANLIGDTLPLLAQKTLSIRKPLLPISNNSNDLLLLNYTSNNNNDKSLTKIDNNNSDQLFENYESILQDVLLIVQEQNEANNVKWTQAIEKVLKRL